MVSAGVTVVVERVETSVSPGVIVRVSAQVVFQERSTEPPSWMSGADAVKLAMSGAAPTRMRRLAVLAAVPRVALR